MSDKILFVDDEINVLQGYQRMLKRDYDIEIAAGGMDGLIAVASQGSYAVIVSDMRMPGMSGIEFLRKVKEIAPESVRIMLTGNADQQTAADAVNEGAIFRFLTKPCQQQTLVNALNAGLQQYRLQAAEKELLSKTLSGAIQVLSEILSMVNPTAFGRSSRVRRLVRKIGAATKMDNAWQVEIAAMLSQVGCVTIPEETLLRANNGQSLTPDEMKIMKTHPQIGASLINHIPRLEAVAEIIAYQEKLYNGGGAPFDNRKETEIPIGARILKLALDYDKLVQSRMSQSEALREIHSRKHWYDPDILKTLDSVLVHEFTYERKLAMLHEFTQEMLLAEDINSVKGLLLITKGQEVTPSIIARLTNFLECGAIQEPFQVLVPIEKKDLKSDPSTELTPAA